VIATPKGDYGWRIVVNASQMTRVFKVLTALIDSIISRIALHEHRTKRKSWMPTITFGATYMPCNLSGKFKSPGSTKLGTIQPLLG